MLRISLQQFRCWENLVIEAPIGGVTLIKGGSGYGKTTVFQAITWCLYGGVRLVHPNHLEKAKTRVTIEFPYTMNGVAGQLTIMRKKNSNQLLLSHGGNSYEDKVAQSIIDDLFGAYDIWLASCYIGQGCRNSFLTAPNAGKMEFLNSIAFHEEDPTSYIEKIDATITETDAEYKGKLAVFTNNVNAFQSLLTNTDTTKALSPEQVAAINTQIETVTRQRTTLQAEKAQRDVDIGMLANLQRQLDQANAAVVAVPKADDTLHALMMKYGGIFTNAEEVQFSINEIQEIIPKLQRRDQLESEMRRYDSLLLPYVNFKNADVPIYTTADYQEAVSKEIAFRDGQKLAQSLGVLYSENAINEAIQRHRDTLASQERLKLERERDALQMRIGMLEMEHVQQATPLQFPDLTPQEIPVPDYSKYATTALSEQLTELSKQHGALQAHIAHLQKGRDVLQCPQCKGSLRYQNGNLILAETGPANIDELTAAQQQLISINADIVRINRTIQSLSASEASDRSAYEQALALEQRRLNALKERAKQLELEKQRRDIANQARVKQILDLKEDLERCFALIAALGPIIGDHRILSNVEIEQTHSTIGRLSSISILGPPPVSSQQIQSYLTYQDLLAKSAIVISAHSEYLETISIAFKTESVRNLQTYIEQLRTYWARIREAAEERIRIERLRTSLETQIQTVTARIQLDPTSEIERINVEIAGLQQMLTLHALAQRAIQVHAQVTREREEVIALNNTLGDLQTLRQHAVETECRILQQVVDSMNASIQGVCGTLFDRDINIELNLFKTMKTTGNVKPVANFSISYQGGNFGNIDQLSGGEGDRASLALTLALNRLSSCPILMLDESLASLDLNMKEAAIRTIRENTNNTVLIIMHDGIEGVFSHVIPLEEFAQGRY